MDPLNSKDVKKLKVIFYDQYGIEHIPAGTYWRQEDKYWLWTGTIIPENIRTNSLGLYIGELKFGEFRFSIEGAQFIAKAATKNLLDLTDVQLNDWWNGVDVECVGDNAMLILTYSGRIIGCAKRKNGRLLNVVPKARRASIH